MVNEVSRRKSTAKDRLKANYQEGRIQLWKYNIENLLRNTPKVTQEPVTSIICKQLDIKLGQLKSRTRLSTKENLKNSKTAGLDEIPPEV